MTEQRAQTWLEWGQACPLVPVVAVGEVEAALGLAAAFEAAGVRLMEIVLRLEGAMDCVAAVARACPELIVGVGTITHPEQLEQARRAGARFAISPGATDELLRAMGDAPFACMPGVATVSEAMAARAAGLRAVKVFPASTVGGAAFIQSAAAVLPDMHFCPTGGVGLKNVASLMAAPSVFAFGASWVCTGDLIEARDWAEVTRRCRAMLDAAAASS